MIKNVKSEDRIGTAFSKPRAYPLIFSAVRRCSDNWNRVGGAEDLCLAPRWDSVQLGGTQGKRHR